MTLDERLVRIIPSERQLKFQQLEFYAFVHFSMNTFTGREWGDGKESPAIFNPTEFDAEQWVRAVASAGMKGLILTCKHHDGFCLWQTEYTKHSVASSPYKNGRGDIVREVSDACGKYGIKFGAYLSPWDRNSPLYGHGDEYNDYFVNQLTELLTNYGEIFCVWLDGACGEGGNGRKQVYDWDRYYSVIRKLQPSACINVCGPDIRWCGNEAGHTRRSEWSVVPARTADTEKIQSASQHTDSDEFRTRKIHAQDADLGSREILKDEAELIWYPAEVNTSIRPGWFYHDYEDEKVRPLDELINIYNCSAGGNSTFLLNIPPAPNGLFHKNDVKRLAEIGKYLLENFSSNILDNAVLKSSEAPDGYEIENVREDNYDKYFKTADGVKTAEIEIIFNKKMRIKNIVLKENITRSQRIESFSVESELNGSKKEIYSGTVVGYKKIIPLENVYAEKIYIKITDSRVAPTLSFIGVYGD